MTGFEWRTRDERRRGRNGEEPDRSDEIAEGHEGLVPGQQQGSDGMSRDRGDRSLCRRVDRTHRRVDRTQLAMRPT